MLVLETKLRGNPTQFAWIDEGIKTAQFIRNKCVRYWMENKDSMTSPGSVLYWQRNLNGQASAERAWSAIKRFYDNCKCKAKKPGKKGFPKFKKNC
ncbi:MAG: hypothetical protein Q6L68_15170, partial [Thermostichus sp. DG02_5_bins_236]